MTTSPTTPNSSSASEQQLCALLSDLVADQRIAAASASAAARVSFAWCELHDDGAGLAYTNPPADPSEALALAEQLVVELMNQSPDLPTQLRLDRCRVELSAARDLLTQQVSP